MPTSVNKIKNLWIGPASPSLARRAHPRAAATGARPPLSSLPDPQAQMPDSLAPRPDMEQEVLEMVKDARSGGGGVGQVIRTAWGRKSAVAGPSHLAAATGRGRERVKGREREREHCCWCGRGRERAKREHCCKRERESEWGAARLGLM